MSKINVEKILKQNNCFPFKAHSYNDILEAIKEIIEAVVDKCAEEARTKTTSNFDGYESSDYFEVVDKDSILQVKQMIDYE